jgi:hypothetical protein
MYKAFMGVLLFFSIMFNFGTYIVVDNLMQTIGVYSTLTEDLSEKVKDLEKLIVFPEIPDSLPTELPDKPVLPGFGDDVL